MSASTRPLLVRPIEREDDLSLFFWLVRELEQFEAALEAAHRSGPAAAERRRPLERLERAVGGQVADCANHAAALPRAGASRRSPRLS
ncbi:MAG: hypothetical protein ACHQ01_09470 [Candidatus Limnocylindrales bacterium]